MHRSAPRATVCLLLLAGLAGACGDDDGEAFDPPMVMGPYLEPPHLEPNTRQRLPGAAQLLGPGEQPWFYWYHPEAPGMTITWEVRAESTALAPGTLIHTEAQEVGSGDPYVQGNVRFDPTRLNRGGARRNAEERLEWLPGIYSVKGRLDDGDPFATGIFEVR